MGIGHTYHEIAEASGIITKTLYTYRLRLLLKLKLSNIAKLSRFTIQKT